MFLNFSWIFQEKVSLAKEAIQSNLMHHSDISASLVFDIKEALSRVDMIKKVPLYLIKSSLFLEPLSLLVRLIFRPVHDDISLCDMDDYSENVTWENICENFFGCRYWTTQHIFVSYSFHSFAFSVAEHIVEGNIIVSCDRSF